MTDNNIPTLRLRRGKEESLDRLHPWVFSGALTEMPRDIEEGTVVRVAASDGRLIGVGHFQIGSIAVRMLDFADTAIDDAFFAKRLAEAYALRRTLGLQRPDNTAFRLVHGEGDFLPGGAGPLARHAFRARHHSPRPHRTARSGHRQRVLQERDHAAL